MIYLGENIIGEEELTELFVKNSFTKREEAYYYVTEYIEDNIHLCVKFWNKFSSDRFEIEVVKVFIDENSQREETILNEEIANEEDRENALLDFFSSIDTIESTQSVMMFGAIFELVKEYVEDGYFFADDDGDSAFKNTLYGEFMNVFTIQGEVVEGYYEGNLVLTGIKLINNASKEVIKTFERVNVASNFYLEEDDDMDYMIEAYLESMSEYSIKDLFIEAIR